MLRILFAISILFSIPAGNSSNHHTIEPGIDELNTEQVRQIAACMLQFHKESLASVTIFLQKDPTLYAFFEHKKGKKYKVQRGQCTLEKLKIFSSYLQDDIYDLTVQKGGLAAAHAQFIIGTIAKSEFDEFLDSYGISDRGQIDFLVDFYSKRIQKLENVKTHIDDLISTTVPKAVTLKRAWKYFKHHLPDYFHDLSTGELKNFKPKFLTHVSDYYGFGY